MTARGHLPPLWVCGSVVDYLVKICTLQILLALSASRDWLLLYPTDWRVAYYNKNPSSMTMTTAPWLSHGLTLSFSFSFFKSSLIFFKMWVAYNSSTCFANVIYRGQYPLCVSIQYSLPAKLSVTFVWLQPPFTELRQSCFGLGAAQAWLKEMGVSARG